MMENTRYDAAIDIASNPAVTEYDQPVDIKDFDSSDFLNQPIDSAWAKYSRPFESTKNDFPYDKVNPKLIHRESSHNERSINQPVSQLPNDQLASLSINQSINQSSKLPEKFCLDSNDLSIESPIGNGAFGLVFAGSYQGRRVAVKVINQRVNQSINRSIDPATQKFIGKTVSIPSSENYSELTLDSGDQRSVANNDQAVNQSINVDNSPSDQQLFNQSINESIENEASILSLIPYNPNVVEFIGVCYVNQSNHHSLNQSINKLSVKNPINQFALVTGLCNIGNLESLLLNRSIKQSLVPTINQLVDQSINQPVTFTELQQIAFALQAAKGINHLHHQSINHGDLAARNYLIDRVSHSSVDQSINQPVNRSIDHRTFELKVADFGLSTVDLPVSQSVSHFNKRPQLFAVHWAAPELLVAQSINQSINQSTDCWSYGVSVWEIFHRRVPYDELPKLKVGFAVSRGRRLSIDQSINQSICQLISVCFSEPHERPSFDFIVQWLEAVYNQSINQSQVQFAGVQATATSFSQSVDQSVSQAVTPTDQSKKKAKARLRSSAPVEDRSVDQVSRSQINESVVHPAKPSIRHAPMSFLSMSQSMAQPESASVNQPMDESIDQSMDQSVADESISQPMGRKKPGVFSMLKNKVFGRSRKMSDSQSTDRSISPSLDQSSENSSEEDTGERTDQSLSQPEFMTASLESISHPVAQSAPMATMMFKSISQPLVQSAPVPPPPPAPVPLPPSVPVPPPPSAPMRKSINQPITESDDLLSKGSINQEMAQPAPMIFRRSIKQPLSLIDEISQFLRLTVVSSDDLIDVSTSLSVNQSIQSITQSHIFTAKYQSQPYRGRLLTHEQINTVKHQIGQSTSQSVNPPVDQSISQSIDESSKGLVVQLADDTNCLAVFVDEQSINQLSLYTYTRKCHHSTNQSVNESTNQSINKSVNQSTSQFTSSFTTLQRFECLSKIASAVIRNQHSHPSVNQSINTRLIYLSQSVNQSVNPMVPLIDGFVLDPSINWDEDIAARFSPPELICDQSTNQSINQSINEAIHVWQFGLLCWELVFDCQWMAFDQVHHPSINQSNNQSISQSDNQSVSQSTNQPINLHALLISIGEHGVENTNLSINQSILDTVSSFSRLIGPLIRQCLEFQSINRPTMKQVKETIDSLILQCN